MQYENGKSEGIQPPNSAPFPFRQPSGARLRTSPIGRSETETPQRKEYNNLARIMTLRQRKQLLSEIARCSLERTSERLKAIDLLNRLDGAYGSEEKAASGSCCIIDDVAEVGHLYGDCSKYPTHATDT